MANRKFWLITFILICLYAICKYGLHLSSFANPNSNLSVLWFLPGIVIIPGIWGTLIGRMVTSYNLIQATQQFVWIFPLLSVAVNFGISFLFYGVKMVSEKYIASGDIFGGFLLSLLLSFMGIFLGQTLFKVRT